MQFYVLKRRGEPESSARTDFSTRKPNLGEATRCAVCGKFISLLSWLPPYRAELEVLGNDFGDIASGAGMELLVSARFKRLYSGAGLTGFKGFEPVEILRMKCRKRLAKPVPEYFHVTLWYGRAAIDDKASSLIREKPLPCPECRNGGIIKRARRIILEESSWSGEDVFMARGLHGTILVSERFSDFCKANHISNATLIPASDYSFDFYPWEQQRILN
jgi:hypothetical protein